MSEPPSRTPSPLVSDMEELSMGSGDFQPELPEHDECSIHHGGITYKRGKARAAKRQDKPPNAWYWDHGEQISRAKDGIQRWKCEPCWEAKKFIHFALSSNKAIIKHLKNKHKIMQSNPGGSIQLTLTPAEDSDGISIQIPSLFNWEMLKLRLIEWIVVMHIAFSQVENQWFRRFLACLSPTLEQWIPKAGNTVKAWIFTEFKKRQETIKKNLHSSKSRIHLSFDLWTSPNNIAFVGIVGHFMSSKYKVETILLGLRRIYGIHSGENIAEAVLEVIHQYGLIGDQIGWFILDNASSNDTCVQEILNDLNINDTVEHRRLRCLGHIINLSAQAFLFGSDPNAFEEEVEKSQKHQELKKERELWRKQGPLGKLHNIVTYILSTPQRRDEFKEKVQGEIIKQKDNLARTIQQNEDAESVLKHPLTVIRDNLTRWNSIFLMIVRAFILKDPLDLYIKRAQEKPAKASPLPQEDELSTHDWNILARTREILEPFYNLTLKLQGRASNARHGSIWEALPAVDFLLYRLEVKSKEYGMELSETATSKLEKRSRKAKGSRTLQGPTADLTQISTGINNCWEKLRKYYELMDLSPVYVAAVVLNPEHKWDYFETNWEDCPEWITQAKKSIKDFWLTMYKDSESKTKQSTTGDASESNPILQKDPSDFDQWVSRHKYHRTGLKKIQDEYEQYLETDHFPNQQSEDTLPNFQQKSVNLCTFWARYEEQYPALAQMAYDILSIPAMSAECERVFSSAKLLLSDRRARMKEDVIEASECLRAWIKAESEQHDSME